MSRDIVVRIVKNANHWQDNGMRSYVEDGDSPSILLDNFRTKDDNCSVFFLDQDNFDLELSRFSAAIQLTREKISTLNFIFFPIARLASAKIKCNQSILGDTIDSVVNSWHANLEEITSNRIATLLGSLYPLKYHDDQRRSAGMIKSDLTSAFTYNWIMKSNLQPEHKARLREWNISI